VNNKIKKDSKAKKPAKIHKPEKHSWFKRFSIGREIFTVNFSVKQKPVKEANKNYLFKHRKELKGGLTYGAQAFAAVVLLTVIVSMLSWSVLLWNKSVQDRYRPIQLLRSTLGSFGQLAMETITGQNEATATSTSSSIFSLFTEGVKKQVGNIASSVKKQVAKITPSSNPPKPLINTAPTVAANPPPVVATATVAVVEPVKPVVPTTTPATTTPVVKKPEPVKPVVPTTTPVVKASTTPPVVPVPVVTPPETQQTVVQYIVNQVPVVEYPDTTITASPALVTSSTSAHFSFSSTKSVVVYSYSLDNGSWLSTGTSTNFSGLAEGSHVFKVRSTDSAGSDPSPAQYDWRIDLTAPTVSFDNSPGVASNQTAASFNFSANELVTYHYKLDSEAWQQAASASTTVSGLSSGSHMLSLYGVDAVGFQGATIETSWKVDLLAPSALLNDLPPTTDLTSFANSGLTVSFGGTDQDMPNGSGVFSYDVEFAIEGGEWQVWNQALEQNYAVFGQPMSEGQYAAFRVRANDAAGNVSAWTASKQTRFANTQPDHLVISEIQISGANSTDEFVELYNPTDAAVFMPSGTFVLAYKDDDNNENILVDNFDNIQIDAHSYLLVGNANYDDAVVADVSYPSTSDIPINATVVLKEAGQVIDKVGFGLAADFELALYPTNPGNHQSLERKAVATSTDGTMVNGAAHHLLGNSYDSNSNAEDFVLRNQPEPQNVDSATEILAYVTTPDIRYAMTEVSSFISSAWYDLIKSWVNPGHFESLDSFITNTINNVTSEIVAAKLAVGHVWQDFSARIVQKLMNKA